jgi:hypothetical protein
MKTMGIDTENGFERRQPSYFLRFQRRPSPPLSSAARERRRPTFIRSSRDLAARHAEVLDDFPYWSAKKMGYFEGIGVKTDMQLVLRTALRLSSLWTSVKPTWASVAGAFLALRTEC